MGSMTPIGRGLLAAPSPSLTLPSPPAEERVSGARGRPGSFRLGMRRGLAPALLAVALLGGQLALAGEARVTMEQGLVSATFDAVPTPQALEAVRRATGVEIVVPGSVQEKTLTLTVERLPFEPFLRRLLEGLDLGGFALVYEPNGAAQRVIVVDRAKGGEAATVPSPRPASESPTASSGASAGPVYIPPKEPPVYIPPTTPPVYIPPASPPVYVPPATEPREIPPSQ